MSDVDDFVKGFEHPLKKVLQSLRRAILEADERIEEGIKWNVPSFRTEREWFATFNVRAKEGVQLIFHLGAKTRPDLKTFELADPYGLVKWLGKDRAIVTLGAGGDIPARKKALETIVRAWIKQV